MDGAASPLPCGVNRGKVTFKCPFVKLTLSNPLSAYEPAGAPGVMEGGVSPSVIVCAEAEREIARRNIGKAAARKAGHSQWLTDIGLQVIGFGPPSLRLDLDLALPLR